MQRSGGDASGKESRGLAAADKAAREAAFAEEDAEDTDAPLPLPAQLLNWHWANLEYANGTVLASLSNRWWDADDEFDFGGGHYLLPDGYGGLLQKVASGLDVRFGHVVHAIERTPNGVQVKYSRTSAAPKTALEPAPEPAPAPAPSPAAPPAAADTALATSDISAAPVATAPVTESSSASVVASAATPAVPAAPPTAPAAPPPPPAAPPTAPPPVEKASVSK